MFLLRTSEMLLLEGYTYTSLYSMLYIVFINLLNIGFCCFGEPARRTGSGNRLGAPSIPIQSDQSLNRLDLAEQTEPPGGLLARAAGQSQQSREGAPAELPGPGWWKAFQVCWCMCLFFVREFI